MSFIIGKKCVSTCDTACVDVCPVDCNHGPIDIDGAGAEVEKAFTSSCTLDMDFAAGDDIIDGADITSTGFCAEGSNGQSNDVTTGAASTFTQFVSTTDTIDCLIAGAAPATGRLRVYACVIDCNDIGSSSKADEVDRDQLA